MRAIIDNNCSQDWDKMIPDAEGRYCSNCKKVVYDFTCKTDEEIIRLLSASKTVCGRLTNHQLNVDLMQPFTLSPRKNILAYFSAVVLLFSVKGTKAASPAPIHTVEQADGNKRGTAGLQSTAIQASQGHANEQFKNFLRSVPVFKTKKRQFYLGWRFPFLYSVKRYRYNVHMGSVRFLD